MNKSKKIITSVIAVGLILSLSACGGSDAEVASYNLSKAAEQFEVQRRVVFFNGITDKYLLEIDGLCSVETAGSRLDGSLEVTCKVSETEYKKHYLGLSDNVSFFVEQIDGVAVSKYHYRVIFKPDTIVPEIDLETQLVQ